MRQMRLEQVTRLLEAYALIIVSQVSFTRGGKIALSSVTFLFILPYLLWSSHTCVGLMSGSALRKPMILSFASNSTFTYAFLTFGANSAIVNRLGLP
jgi:hypothetical protein